MLLVMVNDKYIELVDQENDLIFISELFECYFSGPWIHRISRCDHSSVVHSTSILLSHYKGLNVESFLSFLTLCQPEHFTMTRCNVFLLPYLFGYKPRPQTLNV